MNASVTLTEVLKLASAPPARFAPTNSRMSGCSAPSAPMLAPRRLPPCLMFSVAQSKILMNDTGPEASPPVEATTSPRGRSRENEKPVPPPVRCTSAMLFSAPKMLSIVSSTGSTKQAESCPSAVPAFMSVGLLGRNSPPASSAWKRCAQCERSFASASATARATRSKSCAGVSITRRSASRRR
jgi:hypothetical protein